ncbi:ATP-binding protein [Streptomyces sp. NPDC102402]|uniref:ATP-binding protein n=1 Tax=Streptomyces TaxID=1883 RepID=UPI0035640078
MAPHPTPGSCSIPTPSTRAPSSPPSPTRSPRRLPADRTVRTAARPPAGAQHGRHRTRLRARRNLVDNATRHATSRVQVTVRTQDQHVILSVHGAGPGVPAENAERVLERFVRLVDARSRDRGGTGLGLPIARELAHHQGTLVFVPSDTGACFQLRLPHPPPRAKDER